MSGNQPPRRAAERLRLERLLGVAMVALVAPAALCAAPATLASAPQFRAPTGPCVLTREVRRTLADGQEIVIRRRYAIRFAPIADGTRVDGDLIGVEVEAPADMTGLADVERSRPDNGLFPLELDSAGLIVARPAAAPSVDAARARTAMAAYLQRQDLTGPERAAALTMAARLQAQAQTTGNTWPADLFRPATAPRQEQRELPLPDGRAGRITATIEASGGTGGLLAWLERRVVTEMDGTARRSVERWSLEQRP